MQPMQPKEKYQVTPAEKLTNLDAALTQIAEALKSIAVTGKIDPFITGAHTVLWLVQEAMERGGDLSHPTRAMEAVTRMKARCMMEQTIPATSGSKRK